MNYQTCPVYDCCGGTIIRDNGMRARCRTCDGRGVVEAPCVPPVTSTREPMVVTVARGTDAHDYAPAKGAAMPDYVHGIREGERRAYWLVAIGALCAMEQAEHGESVAGYGTLAGNVAREMMHGLWFTFITVMKAVAASGDEDASRVLGERGW